VRLWSVAKVALVYSFGIGCAVALASVVVWQLLMGTGLVPNLESLVGDLVGDSDFAFDTSLLLRLGVVGVAAFVLIATSFAIVAAAFYNLLATLMGGVEFDAEERIDEVHSAPSRNGNGSAGGHVQQSADEGRSDGQALDTIVLKS
jgi:hypothetical protein